MDDSEVLIAYAKVATGTPVSLTSEQLFASDVNCDATIDALDASDILMYYAYIATGGSGSFEKFMGITPTVETWQTAYSKQLEAYKNSSDYDATEKMGSMYDLFDINGDYIPELFISDGEYHSAYCRVYSYIDSECVRILDDNYAYGELLVAPTESIIAHYSSDGGYNNLYINKFDGKTDVRSDVFIDNSANAPHETVEYKYNDSSISASDYVNAYNNYCIFNYYTVGRQFSFNNGISADILSENYKMSNPESYHLTELAENQNDDAYNYPQYAETLNAISYGLDNGWSSDDYYNNNLSSYYGAQETKNIEYSLYDLNNDNVPELFIYTTQIHMVDGQPTEPFTKLVEVYAISQNKAVQLCSTSSEDLTYSLCENNCIKETSYGGNSDYKFYKYSGGNSLEFIERVFYNGANILHYDSENVISELSKDEADAIMNKYIS